MQANFLIPLISQDHSIFNSDLEFEGGIFADFCSLLEKLGRDHFKNMWRELNTSVGNALENAECIPPCVEAVNKQKDGDVRRMLWLAFFTQASIYGGYGKAFLTDYYPSDFTQNWSDLVADLGIDHVIEIGNAIKESDFPPRLLHDNWTVLRRQVACALISWGKACFDKIQSKETAISVPSDEVKKSVKEASDLLSLSSLEMLIVDDDAEFLKAIDHRIERVMALLQSHESRSISFSSEEEADIPKIFQALRLGLYVIQNSATSLQSLDEDLDPTLPISTWQVLEVLSDESYFDELISCKDTPIAFSAFYLLDREDAFLRQLDALSSINAWKFYQNVFMAAANIEGINKDGFLNNVELGLRCAKVCAILNGQEKPDAFFSHLFKLTQQNAIDRIINESKVHPAYILSGWKLQDASSHSMWLKVHQQRVSAINSGRGVVYHSKRPSPLNSHHIYCLTKTGPAMADAILRSYLEDVTELRLKTRVLKLGKRYGVPHEDSKKLKELVLSKIYHPLQGGVENLPVFVPPQKSVTCTVKGMKRITRLAFPLNYSRLEALIQFIIFAMAHEHIATYDKKAALRNKIHRTIAKEIVSCLAKSSCSSHQLSLLIKHFRTEWNWTSPTMMGHVVNKGQVNFNWVETFFKENHPIASHFAANILEAGVTGKIDVKFCASVLDKVMVQRDAKKILKQLEVLSPNLSRFPWNKLAKLKPSLVREFYTEIKKASYASSITTSVFSSLPKANIEQSNKRLCT